MEINKNLVQFFRSLLSSIQSKVDKKRSNEEHSSMCGQSSHDAESLKSNPPPPVELLDHSNKEPNETICIENRPSEVNETMSIENLPSEVNEKMCIENLPSEVMENIFSFLGASERVGCERVCRRWQEVVRSRSLWKRIDFSEVIRSFHSRSLSKKTKNEQKDEAKDDEEDDDERRMRLESYYQEEKARMVGFFGYLSRLRVAPSELHLCLDIGDMQDHWLATIRPFFERCDFRNLRRATLNWKETPWKPYSDSFYTWSNSNYSDLIYKHRRRTRQFVPFFDLFTARAPNLEYLSIPFDWSVHSVTHLCRLGGNLKELVLSEYFVPQSFDQSLLDKVLSSLRQLQKLTISIVFGSGLGLAGYQFNSPSIRYLNLSRCKGFAISKMDMPRLKALVAGNDAFPSHYLAASEDNLLHQHSQRSSSHEPISSSSPSSSSTSLPSSPNPQAIQPLCPLLSSSLPETSFLSSSAGGSRYKATVLSRPLLAERKSLTSNHNKEQTSKSPNETIFSASSFPCLVTVLSSGAPNLKRLNHYVFIGKRWPTFIDSSLSKVLFESCSCKLHSFRTKRICS